MISFDINYQNNFKSRKQMLPYVLELKPFDCFSALLNYNDSTINNFFHTNTITNIRNTFSISNFSERNENFFKNNCFVNNFCKKVFNVKKIDCFNQNEKQTKSSTNRNNSTNFLFNKKQYDFCSQHFTPSFLPINRIKNSNTFLFNQLNLNKKKLFMRYKQQNNNYFFKTTRKCYLQRRLTQVFCILEVIIFNMLNFPIVLLN